MRKSSTIAIISFAVLAVGASAATLKWPSVANALVSLEPGSGGAQYECAVLIATLQPLHKDEIPTD